MTALNRISNPCDTTPIEEWSGVFAFGMLCDRDVAPQAYMDVLAAVPKAETADRSGGAALLSEQRIEMGAA